MGRRAKHIALATAGVILAVVVLLFTGLNIIVNSRMVRNYVDKLVASFVDGEVNYSRIDISLFRNFPNVSVTLDSLAVTYPHGRFAQWDGAGMPSPMLDAGRGTTHDTLARIDRLRLVLNAMELVGGRVRVPEASIRGLGAFLHVYDSTASNLDILRLPESEKDTTAVFSTPMISVGEFSIEDNIRAVYTSQADTLYADARFGRFEVSGNFRFDEDGSMKLRHVSVGLDDLLAQARMKTQTAGLNLDRVRLDEVSGNVFDLSLSGLVSACLDGFGQMDVPAAFDTRLGYSPKPDHTLIDIHRFDGRVAHIPMHVDGNVRMYQDSTGVNASLSVKDCPVDTLLTEYGYKVLDMLRDFSTDASLDLDVDVDGTIAEGLLPAVKAAVNIPRSRLVYTPIDFNGHVSLDADGSMSRSRYVRVNINDLDVVLPGIDLCASGSARDALGADPAIKVKAALKAKVESILDLIPVDLGLIADGPVNIDLDADARLSNIMNLKYEGAHLHADLTSDLLSIQMPADSLRGRIYAADICLDSSPDGLEIHADTDSLRFRLGDTFHIRARDMKNSGRMYISDNGRRKNQNFCIQSSEKNLFLYYGGNGVSIDDSDLDIDAVRRIRNTDGNGRGRGRGRGGSGRQRRAAETRQVDANAFVGHDISVNLDTTIRKYLREWNPTAEINMAGISASLPFLPLRTSVDSIKASFDGDVLQVDTLGVAVGSSDLALQGSVGGLRRALQGRRGTQIDADVKLHSGRLNVNELIAAFNIGQETERTGEVVEGDDSFIHEDLEDAQIEKLPEMSAIVMPSNVVATVDVTADEINYSDIHVRPFSSQLSLKERTLRISDTKVNTEFGDIAIDAFYSTKAKNDISAGLDMSVHEVSADSLIHLLPSVDSLMPALRSFKGKLDCDFSALTQLDTNMNVIIPSVQGVFRINGHDLRVDDAGGLRKITKLLRFKNADIGAIQDLDVNAVMHDSKIEVFPFQLGVDRYRLALYGMQGLDRSMYYHASVLKSPFLIHIGINVFGTFDNWKFSIGLPKYRNGNVPVFTKQLDTMQFNINSMVRNVYERGIDEIRQYNAMQEIERHKAEVGYQEVDGLLGADEFKTAEQLAIEYEVMLEEEDLYAEIDAVLADSYRETAQLMQDYASDIYNKRILRRMERMARKQARKAARKNK